MNRFKSFFLAAALLSLQTARAVEPAVFEATLFGGYRYGGEFADALDDSKLKLEPSASYGISLNLEQVEGAYYELAYSKQEAKVKTTSAFDMSIEYLHIGGTVPFGDPEDRLVPYFVLTVGATRFTPNRNEFDVEIEPSIALGGGVKIPFTKNIGLRAEIRGYATFVDRESELYCLSSDGSLTCEIGIQGKTFMQAQGSIGLTVGF